MKSIVRITVFLVMGLLTIEFRPRTFLSPIQLIVKPECKIKGNISVSSGKKIYHLPGMKDYRSTVISPEKGEKWFCTESEAIASGYRQAPR